jgi:hypothetical protein
LAQPTSLVVVAQVVYQHGTDENVMVVLTLLPRRRSLFLCTLSTLCTLCAFVVLMMSAFFFAACGFNPDFGDGVVACAVNDSSCPPGLTCEADGRCHRPSSAPPPTTTDRDAGPTTLSSLLITDVSVMEGNTGTTDAIFTVRLVPASVRPVRVEYMTVDDTATAPADYAAATGSIFFEPGATSKPFIVKVATNDLVQAQRRFFAMLKNPENATIGLGQADGTIVDDDTFGLVATDTTVVEGTGATEGALTNATFDVHLTSASMNPVSVAYRAVEDTAVEGSDFIRTSGRLVFAPGELKKNVSVPVKANARNDEPVRNFFLTLTNVTGGAPLLRARAQAKIIDDDPVPSLSIDEGVSVMEGNIGSAAAATFHVRLSAASSRRITVNFATEIVAAGGAVAASVSDFGTTAGMLTFEPGQIDNTISIPINGDTIDEEDETFNVRLEAGTATNATIAKAVGVGTILNDDAPPKITIDDLALQEGNAGAATNFPFRLRLSEPSGRTVSVQVETVSETAVAGADFVGIAPATVTFAPGTTEKILNVTVNGDAVAEGGAEKFGVHLSRPSNGSIARADAQGTILDDDSTLAGITISDVAVTENNGGVTFATFTITLSPGAVGPVTVQWATEDETATAGPVGMGGDYIAANGVVTFTSPQESKTVNIAINGDTVFEADETFVVRLTGVSANANILDAEGRCTITNDDTAPEISIVAPTSGGAALEGARGTTKTIPFNITLSSASGREVTVNYFTTDETASSAQTSDADYLRRTGLLVFQPGETTKTISVVVLGDDQNEPDAETFLLTLATPKGATLSASASAAQGKILNDDPAPVIAIGPDIEDSEGAPGPAASNETFRFVVTLDRPSSRPINVSYATADETATAGADYIEANGVLTFAPGETRKVIPVTINGDAEVEQSETFTVTLSSPAGTASLGRAVAHGKILNDDGATPSTPTMTISDAVVVEGNNGGTPYSATFTVVLSAPTTQTVAVQYATSNGTANEATDYLATSGTLSFAPNETTKTINVSVRGDTTVEPDETFFVTLDTPTNAVIFHPRGQATIVNDD